MKEAIIQTWIQDQIKSKYGKSVYIFKVPQGPYTSRRGIPDLCMCIKGKYVAIEVKTDNGTLTKLQEHEIKKINASGGFATTIYGKDDAKLQAIFRLIEDG